MLLSVCEKGGLLKTLKEPWELIILKYLFLIAQANNKGGIVFFTNNDLGKELVSLLSKY